MMRRYILGIAFLSLTLWPGGLAAGGKEDVNGSASLVIGVSGLNDGGKTLTTTIEGLSRGQTLSVGIEPPAGEARMDAITLSPGRNRLDFNLGSAASDRKPASRPARREIKPTPEPAFVPENRTTTAPPRTAVTPQPVPDPAPAPTPASAKTTVPVVSSAGEGFRDCPECPEMVMVPAGSFVMGAGDPFEDARKHTVTIGKPLAVGRFEVTYAEWSSCVQDGVCGNHVEKPDEGENAPAGGINFGDAKRYVQWLSAKTGKTYRLPSEAEWEYVARAGTSTAFWWGIKAGSNRANCFNCGSPWDGKRAAPVGSFAANPFGLHDTAGNVWEWVEDCFDHDAYANHKAYPAPVEGGGFCDRVLRGGGWDIGPTGIRPTFRFSGDPQNRYKFYGLRVVRE